ncbi:splicing factor 3A subunit 1 [Nilaparvata lugens]|uniref:splicing factor 3A subunit 1 n=1 Tax=Nilaparvata lugens TaxID=108931 RepID=UPI00193CC9C8|nr:splicing factor 3A subunit 1 [Nilaparvata lugens]
MPSLDVANPPTESQPENATPTSQPVVGIIYPPPEVRNIVDKTASFVARNGPEFESRIRQNELGNPKFNFLSFGDPYHAYYQHKVKEFREGKGQEPVAPSAVALPKAPTLTVQSKQQEFLSKVSEQPFVPKDPPAEFEFIADPPSISALDFMIKILFNEFFIFYIQLLYFHIIYPQILIPPKDIMFRLKDECNSMYSILDQVKYRADWLKYEEAQKRMEKLAIEKERVAYAQIDWHDFVVVETVDYLTGEVGNFPPPTTPEEVGARVLMQERIDEGGPEENEMQIGSDAEGEEGEDDGVELDSSDEDDEEDEREHMRASKEDDKEKEAKDNTQVQDMEEESSSEEDDDDEDDRVKMAEVPDAPPPPSISGDVKKVPFPAQPPLPPIPDKVIVKKGYDPKQAVNKLAKSLGMDEFLISPINGERIPASKVQEHMRIGLLDPRWVEQRDKHIQDKLNQETVYAPGSAIEASLKQLAERRTDIFGVGDEETAIGKKIGEEDKKKEDKVTWDGHTSSVEAATRAARANITLEEQIHQIHKVKGLLPDEEKEKIGPKPVVTPASAPSSLQSTPLPPPKPPVVAPPPQPPLPLAPLPPPPPGLLPPQPPMMMVPAPLPPIRPPPMMVPPRPPFPVVPNPPMPPGNFMPASAPLPPQPPQPPQPPSMSLGQAPEPDNDEPPAKKMRTEESLMSEDEFLMKNKSPVSFKVSVPNMSDKPEWKLNGQVLSMVLPLQDTVSVIKAKIHESTGMPPGKQKLHLDGLFFKDSNSLAYYNITPGTVIQLQLKERGGRKK